MVADDDHGARRAIDGSMPPLALVRTIFFAPAAMTVRTGWTTSACGVALVEVHATGHQRDLATAEVDRRGSRRSGRRRSARRTRSATSRRDRRWLGSPRATAPSRQPEPEHDRDVVGVDATLVAQLVGGALERVRRDWSLLTDRVPHGGGLDEGAQASNAVDVASRVGRQDALDRAGAQRRPARRRTASSTPARSRPSTSSCAARVGASSPVKPVMMLSTPPGKSDGRGHLAQQHRGRRPTLAGERHHRVPDAIGAKHGVDERLERGVLLGDHADHPARHRAPRS